MQKNFANPFRKADSTGIDTVILPPTPTPARIHTEGERPAFKAGRSSRWGRSCRSAFVGVCGSGWAPRGLGLQGLAEAERLEEDFGGCFNSASGGAGRKGVGVGRGNSGLPQQARIWSCSKPLCPVGRPSVREGAASRLPSPQLSHLVGWPHHSWEEPLGSWLSLVTGLWGWGQPSPQGSGADSAPGCLGPN